jgi:hypothetical protein
MPILCHGCGAAFKCSRLSNHLRQSQNPRCRTNVNNTQTARLPDIDQQSDDDFKMQDTDLPTMSFSGSAVTDAHKNEMQEQSHVTIDPAGDFFGDYASYAALDFGMDGGEDGEGQVDIGATGEEDPEFLAETQEEEIRLYDAVLAEDEQWLEPE